MPKTERDITFSDNAFNKSTDMNYRYQGEDIKYIGQRLVQESTGDPQALLQFAPPLVKGIDIAGLQVDPVRELRKFQDDLNTGYKVVGVFNVGGNHWIAYLLFKDNDGIKCVYKDSLGKNYNDLEEVFYQAFYNSQNIGVDELQILKTKKFIKPIGGSTEQKIEFEPKEVYGVAEYISCGIFALKNMLVLAGLDTEELVKETTSTIIFFNPGHNQEKYNESIRSARAKFAKAFLAAKISEAEQAEIRSAVLKHHAGEGEKLKEIIQMADIEVDIRTMPNDSRKYRYSVKSNQGNKTALSERLKELKIEYIENEDNNYVLLIDTEKLTEETKETKPLLELINTNNQSFDLEKLVDMEEIKKKVLEQLSINSEEKQVDLESISKSSTEQIIKEVDTILTIFSSNSILQSTNSSIVLSEDSVKVIKEGLFRISWRSSEIPSEIRFAKDSPLTEKTWVRLDYLSNALLEMESIGLNHNFFQSIENDLKILKNALQKRKVKEKSEQQQLPELGRFISFFYDKYLLNRIIDSLTIISTALSTTNYSEFLQDEQRCYGVFRALEIVGEAFKNLSSNILDLFEEDVRTGFRELRNVIEHNRPKLELITRHNKVLLEEILKEIVKIFDPIITINKGLAQLKIENFSDVAKTIKGLLTHKISINLEPIKKLTKILNTKNNISKKEREKLFKLIEEQDKLYLEKIVFRLEDNTIETKEALEEVLSNLKGTYHTDTKQDIGEIIWHAYHQIPLVDYLTTKEEILKSRQAFKVAEFRSKLIKRISESNKDSVSYAEILNSIKKIKFANSQDEERFKRLITAHVMEEKKYKSLIGEIDSIDEVLKDSQKKSLDEIFKQLDLLRQGMSDQISIIKKFYYKKFLNNGKPEILSFIDQILPVPFDINQFNKINGYLEKLKNLARLRGVLEEKGRISAEKAQNLSYLYEAYKLGQYLQGTDSYFKGMDNLRVDPEYLQHFEKLDGITSIQGVLDYINKSAAKVDVKQKKNLEVIRKFYLNKFLKGDKEEVKKFIKQTVGDHVKELDV